MNRRHAWYRLRYSSEFAQALVDYEYTFKTLLRDASTHQTKLREVSIDFGWGGGVDRFDALAWRGRITHRRKAMVRIGCLSQLQAMANTIFCEPEAFREIGDENAAASESHHDRGDAPTDPLRHEAACIVAELGLSMIVLHEIAHHALGHLNLHPIGFRLSEHQQQHTRASSRDAPILQACELEADEIGFTHVLRECAEGRSPFSSQLVSEPLRKDIFSFAILAYILVLGSLHDQPLNLKAYASNSHPHPAMRLYASQLAFSSYLGDRPDTLRRFTDSLSESVRILSGVDNFRMLLTILTEDRRLLQESVERLQTAIADARAQGRLPE